LSVRAGWAGRGCDAGVQRPGRRGAAVRAVQPVTRATAQFPLCTAQDGSHLLLVEGDDRLEIRDVLIEIQDLPGFEAELPPDGNGDRELPFACQDCFGTHWIKAHVVAVSGAYGKNAGEFNANSDAVMDAAWNDCGEWLAAHTDREYVVIELRKRWITVLKDNGDIWVKEGGQSDITADVVKRIRNQAPYLDTATRIHVVQHSQWNEDQTTDAALTYARENTQYVRIRDANAYLNIKGGDRASVEAASSHPNFGTAWRVPDSASSATSTRELPKGQMQATVNRPLIRDGRGSHRALGSTCATF
jgi:hypothetical protein